MLAVCTQNFRHKATGQCMPAAFNAQDFMVDAECSKKLSATKLWQQLLQTRRYVGVTNHH